MDSFSYLLQGDNMNERKKNKNIKPERDGYFSVILSQIICSVAVVILFFFTSSTSQGYEIAQSYRAFLKDDFLTAEVDSAVSGMKEYLLEGASSFAVSKNTVVPYDDSLLSESESQQDEQKSPYEAEIQEENDTSEAEINSSEETLTESSSQPSVLTAARVMPGEEKQSSVPLKLVYKREQKMIFPLDEGRYTSYYGERTDPISEGSDFHKGVDIGADEGDRIMAVLDGKVTSTGEDGRSGKYIFLEHENGSVTFYCHCSKVLRKKGDTVKQGETIALVGSTGYSTGPHLHFEVRIKGVSIDPLPLIEHAD